MGHQNIDVLQLRPLAQRTLQWAPPFATGAPAARPETYPGASPEEQQQQQEGTGAGVSADIQQKWAQETECLVQQHYKDLQRMIQQQRQELQRLMLQQQRQAEQQLGPQRSEDGKGLPGAEDGSAAAEANAPLGAGGLREAPVAASSSSPALPGGAAGPEEDVSPQQVGYPIEALLIQQRRLVREQQWRQWDADRLGAAPAAGAGGELLPNVPTGVHQRSICVS
jgi:hypothetical protein